jgi:hypothetical protein
MDSLSTQITQLRVSLAAAMAQVDGLATAAAAIPTATPVGAGLPPTMGAQGPALAWPEVPTHPPGTVAPEALLPPPAPLQAQLTLGVAIPATFGDAAANAEHYLLGKALYEPTQAQREEEDRTYQAWRAALSAVAVAPQGEKTNARNNERMAFRAFRAASHPVSAAHEIAHRYEAYHDGTWAQLPSYWDSHGIHSGNPYFIYRFFVFEELVTGPYTGTQAAHWKPIGLLNPHAYIASKALDEGKTFLSFVDVSQPAPNVTAYWREKMGLEEEEEAPAAAASPAVPAGFSPVIAGADGAGHFNPAAAITRLDPRALSLMEEMDRLEAEAPSMPQAVRLNRLNEHWRGRWTTLPSGERALIWHFHAFAPPADGSYRTSQPLKHLGFYNLHDRTISETSSLPALPSQATWPW